MVFHIIFGGRPSGFVVVAAVLAHAVHADQATSYHFTKSTGIVLTDNAIESHIDECFTRTAKLVDQCLKGHANAYQQLGGRLERRRHLASVSQRVSKAAVGSDVTRENKLAARFVKRASAMAAKDPQALKLAQQPCSPAARAIAASATHTGYLLKTPSSRGPISVLHSMALSFTTANARRDMLMSTPPTHPTTRDGLYHEHAHVLRQRRKLGGE